MNTISLCALMVLSACQSTTTLRSSDPESTIYVSESQTAKGSLDYSDHAPMWSGVNVEVRKSGCAAKKYRISKFDEFSTANFIMMPLTFGITGLWLAQYRPIYELQFDCVAQSGTQP